MENTPYDIIIVGAGLSGIGAACHLQRSMPDTRFLILEERKTMGGTWDIHKYPGIRSDSDMYTLGYSFKPWLDRKAIADGPSILNYIKETAEEFNIGEHIQYDSKVDGANWSNTEKLWTVKITTKAGEDKGHIKCKFLHLCAGYYDMDNGYIPNFKGRDTFKGAFIHPQKWDTTLDYKDKDVVVIGSGATAVTLVPELAKQAKSVTMLQRSPTYVVSLPEVDPIAQGLHKFLPEGLAHHMIRWKNIMVNLVFYSFCQAFPKLARKLLISLVAKSLRRKPEDIKDFHPNYGPWDQRLCAVPDGDLFKTLREQKAKVVTGSLDTITETGVQLKSGEFLPADIIVSATGFNLKLMGGVKLSIDDKPIQTKDLVSYKGIMFSGVPNLSTIFGYTNSSWTLKADLLNKWVIDLIKHMRKNNYAVAVPDDYPAFSDKHPLIDLSSGYIQRSAEMIPKQGEKDPWKVNNNYLVDFYLYRFRPVYGDGLKFSKP